MRRRFEAVLDLAGFHVYKWISSEPEVNADVAEEDRASEIDLGEERIANNQDSGCPVGRHRRRIFL